MNGTEPYASSLENGVDSAPHQQSNGVHKAADSLTQPPSELLPNSFYGASKPKTVNPFLVNHNAAGKPEASDSDFSEPQREEDDGSDFEAAQSDDSDYSGSRKRQKRAREEKAYAKFHKPREDTAMRRKLRSVAPVSEPAEMNGVDQGDEPAEPSAGQRDRISETDDESSLTKGELSDPLAIPERSISEEQLLEQRAWLKTCWEFIAILDFLSSFQPWLGMESLQFSADELESSLILNNGTNGLVADLHIALIKGISTRSGVHNGNWTSSFAEKLKAYWRAGPLKGHPPFYPQRRFEAPAYATLPLEQRVSALRILCELRLDRDDLHNVVEVALHPPKKTKAEKRALETLKQSGKRLPPEDPLPSMSDIRREPTAKDSSGLLYWYLDYNTTTGTRLYREVPVSMWKSKKKESEGPDWELLATDLESLTEVGEKLRRSKKKADQDLADMILDEFVAELLERRERDLKKQRAAAKLQAQLRNIMPEGGRSRRARKAVDYSYDAFDASIKAALREGKEDSGQGRLTRSAAQADSREIPDDDPAMGRRRGRSTRAASPAGEHPAHRRLRNQDHAEPSSNATSMMPSEDITPEPETSEQDHDQSSKPAIATDQPADNTKQARFQTGSSNGTGEQDPASWDDRSKVVLDDGSVKHQPNLSFRPDSGNVQRGRPGDFAQIQEGRPRDDQSALQGPHHRPAHTNAVHAKSHLQDPQQVAGWRSAPAVQSQQTNGARPGVQYTSIVGRSVPAQYNSAQPHYGAGGAAQQNPLDMFGPSAKSHEIFGANPVLGAAHHWAYDMIQVNEKAMDPIARADAFLHTGLLTFSVLLDELKLMTFPGAEEAPLFRNYALTSQGFQILLALQAHHGDTGSMESYAYNAMFANGRRIPMALTAGSMRVSFIRDGCRTVSLSLKEGERNIPREQLANKMLPFFLQILQALLEELAKFRA